MSRAIGLGAAARGIEVPAHVDHAHVGSVETGGEPVGADQGAHHESAYSRRTNGEAAFAYPAGTANAVSGMGSLFTSVASVTVWRLDVLIR